MTHVHGHPRVVVVTQELIEAGATSGCGFTNKQIRLLDGPGRPRKGWRYRAIGKRLPIERAMEFLTAARRAKHRPQPGSAEWAVLQAVLDRAAIVPRRPADDAACPLCRGSGEPCMLEPSATDTITNPKEHMR